MRERWLIVYRNRSASCVQRIHRDANNDVDLKDKIWNVGTINISYRYKNRRNRFYLLSIVKLLIKFQTEIVLK